VKLGEMLSGAIVVGTRNMDVLGSTPGGDLHARCSPSLLSFRGRRIGTSFDWVNGSAPLSRSSLVKLWRVINACHSTI